jgi:hypothetical protein
MGRHQVPCGIGMVSSRASATLTIVPLVRLHDHGAHCKVPVLFLGAADFERLTQADDKRGTHASQEPSCTPRALVTQVRRQKAS